MIDQIATNFLNSALSVPQVKITLHKNYAPKMIETFYLPWDGETVKEIALEKKVSNHEWKKKKKLISFFRKAVRDNTYYEVPLIVVRKNANSPHLIIDGVHRTIGAIQAINEKGKEVNFRILFIESEKMDLLYDYNRLFP